MKRPDIKELRWLHNEWKTKEYSTAGNLLPFAVPDLLDYIEELECELRDARFANVLLKQMREVEEEADQELRDGLAWLCDMDEE